MRSGLFVTASVALASGALADSLILHYPLTETSGTVATDDSGNGNDGTIVGDPTLDGAAGIRLDGTDDCIQLPDNIMNGLTSMSISIKTLIRNEQNGNYFIFGLGNSINGSGDGYVFATGDPYRAAISSGNWDDEAESKTDSDLEREVWHTVTYVIDGTSSTSLYLDGVLVAGHTNDVDIVTPDSLGDTDENYIGRSQYSADNYLAGSVRDFRIYDYALSASDVTALTDSDSEKVAMATAELAVANINDVRGNLYLPTTWDDDISVSWATSSSSVISTDGVVNRQSSDTTATLTATLSYNGITNTKTMTATVRAAVDIDEYEAYMFAYFTGSSVAGEKIYLAASDGNDALQWSELNDGEPYLTSTKGTTGLRDPFIIRSPEGDTFYLIATDLSIGSGTSWGDSVKTGSRYLEVWESHDLINWGEQRHVLVCPETCGNTWAPEAFYDTDLGSYVVYWASSLYDESDTAHTGSTYHRMLISQTRDFVSFSEPEIWQDAGMSRIDSTVIYADGTYYRFTKDEGASGTGCSDIIQESSDDILDTLDGWTILDTCIGADAGTSAVEGPTAFKSNPADVNGNKYYLFVDEYGGRGYIPLEAEDIAAGGWQVSDSYSLPSSPRHGTVLPITADEWSSLTGALTKRQTASRELLRYDFSVSDGQLVDMSGNENHGTIQGDATVSDGVMTFDGSDDYVDLPENLLADTTDITVECEVLIDSDQSTPYFIWGIGNTVSDSGYGYIFTTGDVYRTSIAIGDYSTEQTVTGGSDLTRGSWHHLVYTLSGDTATIYLNGIQTAQSSEVTSDPSDIGSTSASYLGRSMYTSDNLLVGQMRKFAIYRYALTASEVLGLSGNTGAIAGVTLSDASLLKVDPIINDDIQTVVFPVVPGTDVTSLAPVFSTSSNVTSSPASGTVVDLSEDATYTLTSDGEVTGTWIMKAVEMRSPVLPGLYADPNIAIFDNVAYIYATTDGYASWGGNVFYVWKSTNMIDWIRSDEPFLTLDGTNGNVPWATGNAWAPTMAEKDGKYYFYFSGNNPTYDRKTIGVAVASSPEGPFTAEENAMILNNEAVTTGQAIDPAAFKDPVTGKWYLYWGNSSPVYAELADNMTSIKEDTITAISGLTGFREGTFINYRDGIYHFTYSIDDTGSEDYRVGYATSDSADGPWTYQGVILQKDSPQGILATGHSSIVNIPSTDEWYIAYHRFHIPGGDGAHRETTIDRLYFDPNTGLIENVIPTLTSVDARPLGKRKHRIRGGKRDGLV
ncbi:glycosyl hydrolase family 43 [Zalerion maritima]|uniref:Endo-1,5-alpha-L-arabinanase A n=1 Tax=Zalerion maritima TaxID=339359 RepID=A0AAD5RJQ2_9PEZI|nr:glycosyl hydrolase family 43 [Zalerion maritima]